MITDDEVINTFKEMVDLSLDLIDEKESSRKTQMFRGSLYADMNCTRHLYVFSKTNIIPEYCFKCYKVIVEPRNLIELFKLIMIFGATDFPVDNVRKCMVEKRPEYAGSYKGFVYCKTVKEASLICRMVEKLVSEKISPQVSVKIKRGCSEYASAYPKYEIIGPESKVMQYKKKWKIKEDLIDAAINKETVKVDLSGGKHTAIKYGESIYDMEDILRMQNWVRYAATIGDMSYLKLTARSVEPLFLGERPPFIELIPVTTLSD